MSKLGLQLTDCGVTVTDRGVTVTDCGVMSCPNWDFRPSSRCCSPTPARSTTGSRGRGPRRPPPPSTRARVQRLRHQFGGGWWVVAVGGGWRVVGGPLGRKDFFSLFEEFDTQLSSLTSTNAGSTVPCLAISIALLNLPC